MIIWAHTIVKNEERYVWFAIMSVINYVDKVLVYDTGSTDKTVAIIKEVITRYPNKIILREVGNTDIDQFTEVRQQMLQETAADWVWILDADEVWWDGAAKEQRQLIEGGNNLESIVVHYHNIVGDIYHIQPKSAGRYKIDDTEGHLTIRAMNMAIPGLHVSKPHGIQGFYDKDGTLIQERSKKKRLHIGLSYLHFTHMPRSSSRSEDTKVPKRAQKHKKELGIPLPLDFYYPEVFFIPRPDMVPSPWIKRSITEELESAVYTLPRMIKRKLWKGGSGY